MSSKPKHKDHRRQEGGKRGRGLSPAELEAQDALQLGRQADTPAQDAPVVATASAGEETPAEVIEPGGRPVFRTADGGLATENATDQISGEALRQAADAARQEPKLGNLNIVEVDQPVKPAATTQKTSPAPRRKVWKWLMWTVVVVFTLLGVYVALRAGWMPRIRPSHAVWAVVIVSGLVIIKLFTKFRPTMKVVGLTTTTTAVMIDSALAFWAGYEVFDMIEFAGTRMVPAVIVGGLVAITTFVLVGYVLMTLVLVINNEPAQKKQTK